MFEARKIAQEQATKQLNTDIQCLKDYENACKSGAVSSEDFTRIMGKASTQAQEYSKNIKDGTGSAQIYADKQKTLQKSIQNTGTASKVAAVGVKALSIAGNMLAGMAMSFAISKVIEGIEYLATASERAIEKTKELQQEISQISSDYQSERQTLEGLREEYDALTSKIGENGAEASLSADEYERYRDITSEILGITPKLITGWDEEGRAISNKNGLLQQSIDLLDEEYQKSLRNSTTKSKNEEIATGIIEQKKDFDNSGDTKTASGTIYDLVWKDFTNYSNDAIVNYNKNKKSNVKPLNDYTVASQISEYVYGEFDYNNLNGSDYIARLGDKITSSQENFEKFVNSLSNEDNPIYQWFTDEQIDELIRGADEYFQELARIEGEEQQYFQQYKDQLNLNAQAVGDAYSGLDEQTKAGITQMIDSFDYNDMTKEKFSDMATDLKDFVGKLSTDDTLLSYFNNLFKPMGEDESIEDYETRVKTGIDEITSYCESNYPAIKLSFGDVESDVEDLKLKYNTAISKFTGDANDIDLAKFFEDNSINDESEIDYWNKVTDGAQSATEAVEMYNKVKSETFSNEITVFSDFFALEDAQGEITTLGELNDKINELQESYTGLKKAMDSYKETGYFTLDQVQEIISYGGEYLKYLMDEKGNLQLNEEALNNVAMARINEMRAKAISNLMDNLDKITSETSALEHLKTQLLETTSGYDSLAQSRITLWLSSVKDSDITDETKEKIIKSFKNQVNSINEMFDNISIGSIYGDDVNKTISEYKDILQKQTNLLEKQFESEIITFEEYTDKRKSIIDNYYKQGLISAEDYYSALEDMYDYQLSIYDKVSNAVVKRFNKKIDNLESDKKDIENLYNSRISKIQEEIDALEKSNSVKKAQIELEKALYDVERARNQRDVKLYSGSDKGVTYTNDTEKLREASDNLNDKQLEIHISKLKTEIESLEKEMKKSTDVIDEQIDGLNDYIDKLKDVADSCIGTQEDMYAASVLGADWEKSIFENREEVLDKFTNNYISAYKEMEYATLRLAEVQAKINHDSGSGFGDDKVGDHNEDGKLYEHKSEYYKPSTKKDLESELNIAKDGLNKSKSDYDNASLKLMQARMQNADAKTINELKSNMENKKKAIGYYEDLIYGLNTRLQSYHTGLDNGYVGSVTDDKRLKILQTVGSGNELKQNEVPAILKKKELILTEVQQDNIIAQLLMGNQNIPMPNIKIPQYDFSILKHNNQQSNVTIGDIHLHEVQNVPDFAKALQKHLPNISVQYNGKH